MFRDFKRSIIELRQVSRHSQALSSYEFKLRAKLASSNACYPRFSDDDFEKNGIGTHYYRDWPSVPALPEFSPKHFYRAQIAATLLKSVQHLAPVTATAVVLAAGPLSPVAFYAGACLAAQVVVGTGEDRLVGRPSQAILARLSDIQRQGLVGPLLTPLETYVLAQNPAEVEVGLGTTILAGIACGIRLAVEGTRLITILPLEAAAVVLGELLGDLTALIHSQFSWLNSSSLSTRSNQEKQKSSLYHFPCSNFPQQDEPTHRLSSYILPGANKSIVGSTMDRFVFADFRQKYNELVSFIKVQKFTKSSSLHAPFQSLTLVKEQLDIESRFADKGNLSILQAAEATLFGYKTQDGSKNRLGLIRSNHRLSDKSGVMLLPFDKFFGFLYMAAERSYTIKNNRRVSVCEERKRAVVQLLADFSIFLKTDTPRHRHEPAVYLEDHFMNLLSLRSKNPSTFSYHPIVVEPNT